MLRSPLNLRALAISYILSMSLLKMLVFIWSPPWEYFVTFSTLRMVLQLSNIFVFNTPVQWSVTRSCYIMDIYSDISSMYETTVSTQTVERGHCLNKQCLSKTDSEIHNTQETVCISWLNSCSYKNYEDKFTQSEEDHFSSIVTDLSTHPFFFHAFLGLGHEGSSLIREAQTSLSISSSSSKETPRSYQASWEISLQRVLDLPEASSGPSPSLTCLEDLTQEAPKKHTCQMPEQPQLTPFTVEK